MSLGSDEVPTPDEGLHDALIGFTGCIGTALEDICSYGLTIGEGYVPFDPDPEDDCEEEEVSCSQAWVRVMSVHSKGEESWGGECAAVLVLDLEVGVLRCFEIPEKGEAPTASDVLLAAMQAMTDMNAIRTAALGCEVWDAIDVGEWSPMGPMGGQYGGTWTFTVEFSGCVNADEIGRVCGMWTGDGPPPALITGAHDGDEYVDLITGDVYQLSL